VAAHKSTNAVFIGLSIICGLLAAAVLFEVILQITDSTNYDTIVNDPTTGLLHYKPGISFTVQSQCYSNEIHINSEGFNAPEWPPVSKSPHEYRIEILSASYIDSEQVPLMERMTTKLQQKLNAEPNQPYTYEVIPIAFGGTGTFLDILYYLRYGQSLHPDLVINLTTENIWNVDATGNGGQYAVPYDSQGNLITALPSSYKNSQSGNFKALLRKSKFLMTIGEKLQGYVGQAQSDVHAYVLPLEDKFTHTPNQVLASNSGWSIEEKLFTTFSADVKNTPAKFMVMSWATPFGTPQDAQVMHDNLTMLSAKDGFPYFDLSPSIAEQASSTGVSPVWPCDPHWSAAGNSYAAEGLYEYLESHPSLLGK
jgi:hypothetical protein